MPYGKRQKHLRACREQIDADPAGSLTLPGAVGLGDGGRSDHPRRVMSDKRKYWQSRPSRRPRSCDPLLRQW